MTYVMDASLLKMWRLLQNLVKIGPRGPCPNEPPTQRCDSSSSYSTGTLCIFAFMLLNEDFTGWSAFIHCVVICRTSSTNLSVVSPLLTKMIVHCVCYILSSFPSIVCESFPTSSSQGYIHAVIRCIFFYISLIYACRDVPSFNWANCCMGAKVHIVSLISSYHSCLSLISTSIFFTYGSSYSEAHSSSVSSNNWLHSVIATPILSMSILMATSRCYRILGGMMGCSFNCSSLICIFISKWTFSTCAFDSLNASASCCTLSFEVTSDWIWSSRNSLHTLEMAYSSFFLHTTASSRS